MACFAFRRLLSLSVECSHHGLWQFSSEQQKTLNAKLRGHYQYGLPTNYRSIGQFYRRVQRVWEE